MKGKGRLTSQGHSSKGVKYISCSKFVLGKRILFQAQLELSEDQLKSFPQEGKQKDDLRVAV